ncbi:phosphatase PAP2 family protein [Agromyces arachidis]|uniref:phosphatase PAP2 family protein n=1 Tax=Agromyces arachidis TaxID=766966 RepID=UPI0040563830
MSTDEAEPGQANRAPAPLRVSRRPWAWTGVIALAVVAAVGVVIVINQAREPFAFESALMGAIVDARTPLVTSVALGFDWLGSGLVSSFVIPAIVVVALVLWRRPWGAGYFVAAIAASGLLTQVVKVLVGRVRPEDILVTPDFGSFPSGHASNAAVMATAFGLTFMRTWVWVAGAAYAVIMMASRMYLGAHWVSDVIGGMLLGAGAAVIVWAPFAEKLYRENRMPHPPPWRRIERTHGG